MGIYWYFWVSFRCSWSWYDVWLFILSLKTSWHHDDRPQILWKPSILADFVWHDSTRRRGSLLCHYQVEAEVQVPHSAFTDIKGKVFILLWSMRFLLPTRPPLILSRLKGIEMPHYYSPCGHQLHHWLGGVWMRLVFLTWQWWRSWAEWSQESWLFWISFYIVPAERGKDDLLILNGSESPDAPHGPYWHHLLGDRWSY